MREPRPHLGGVEWPVEFARGQLVVEHRNSLAIMGLELRVSIDEDAGKVRGRRKRQHRKRLVAQMAVVALVQSQAHAQAWMNGEL